LQLPIRDRAYRAGHLSLDEHILSCVLLHRQKKRRGETLWEVGLPNNAVIIIIGYNNLATLDFQVFTIYRIMPGLGIITSS